MDDVPEYDDVDISDVEKQIDYLRPSDRERKKQQLQQEISSIDKHDGFELPEEPSTVWGKFRVSPSIPNNQKDGFDRYKPHYERHVAWSNTKRSDNPVHRAAIDYRFALDRIPILRHLSNEVAIREIADYQMCRSNPEIGGFEAKIGVTNIRREDVDVKQTQNLPGTKKKRRIFGLGGRKE